MSDQLSDALQAVATVVTRFRRLLVEDDEFRTSLRAIATAVLDLTELAPPSANTDSSQTPPLSVASPELALSPAAPPSLALPRTTEPLPPLTFGSALRAERIEADAARRTFRSGPPTDADLPLIEQRCRLKAEGAQWAAQRRIYLDDGADYQTEIVPGDRELIRRAKEIEDCYLWMNTAQWQPPHNLSLLDDLAGCFDALADALALVRLLLAAETLHNELFLKALELLAEAQSALRLAAAEVNFANESEQVKVFTWLRGLAAERQIMIQRFMRLSDPADAHRWEDLQHRISDLSATAHTHAHQDKERRRLFGKIRYVVSQLQAEAGDTTPLWQTLVQTVEELLVAGVPATNRELRDLLVPVVDHVPSFDEVPAGFGQVLAEIDQFLSTRTDNEPAPAELLFSDDVQAAAKLLAGRTMVLIGGDKRHDAHDKLVRALQLSDLEWIPTREHQSITRFAAAVARPEVAVVVLAIRWASHSYGEVIRFCEEHGKPLVRLPAGYNPNQVAAQILAQCGDRLVNATT